MEINREFFDKVVSDLTIGDNFGLCIDEGDYDVTGILDRLEDVVQNTIPPDEFLFRSGVTKLVLVPKNQDYVLKFPFFGEWLNYCDTYYDDDEDYDEEEYEDSWEFREYSNACDEDCSDYCLDELSKYKLACGAGFGIFFPETQFYGLTADKHPVYIQEKVYPFWDYDDRETSVEKARKRTDINEFPFSARKVIGNDSWLTIAIDMYGGLYVKEFIEFLRENDMASDLHDGNIGFNSAGAPVILDWAGWRG